VSVNPCFTWLRWTRLDDVAAGGERTDHDSGLSHAFDQGLVQLGVRGDVGHHIDTGGHDFPGTGHGAHMTDDEQAAAVRGSDQCLDGSGVQRGP